MSSVNFSKLYATSYCNKMYLNIVAEEISVIKR